jgi:hypothetical protein
MPVKVPLQLQPCYPRICSAEDRSEHWTLGSKEFGRLWLLRPAAVPADEVASGSR